MQSFDAVVIGAGAAGLFCAGAAGQRGLRVLLIDHAPKVAEKIRISGGGRCNFTNRHTGAEHFVSANPDFCRSALARYTPADFIALVERHGIGYHEKHKGQLFCDESSDRIIEMLLAECARGRVERWQPCTVDDIGHEGGGFEVTTDRGRVRASQVVISTGGLSIPKIGATDFGYRMARRFGHKVVDTRPALVPLTFPPALWAPFAGLSGIALEVQIATGERAGRAEFLEDLLFTHRGLSGPAVLQISTYWRPGASVQIDLAPGTALADALPAGKTGSRRLLSTELARHLPARLAQAWLDVRQVPDRPLAEVSDRQLRDVAGSLHDWALVPDGTEGYRKAEVTAGGVDTRELESRTLQSRRSPGLYFIGEVVDVTGWLGGFNFQWAWASAMACARALGAGLPAGPSRL